MKLKIAVFFILGYTIINPAVSTAQVDTVSFEDLLSAALENNFGILVSKNNAEISDNNNTLGNAGFLPELNVTGTGSIAVNNTRQVFFDGRTREAASAQNKAISGLAELSWTFFDGLRMFAAQDRLQELERIGQLELRWQAEMLYLELATQYYRLAQEQKLHQVLQVSMDVSRSRLDVARRKFEIGAGSELDLNQAIIDMSTDSALLIRQRVTLENLVTDINFITGNDPEKRFAASYEIPLSNDFGYAQLKENLLAQNINLLLARADMSVAYQQIKENRSFLLPQASLYSSYSLSKSKAEVGILQSNQSYGFGYGFRFSYNLFNGLNSRREVMNSKINYNTAEIRTDEIILQSESELLKNYTTWENAITEVSMERANVQYSRKNLQIAVDKYRIGALNEIDFRDIQRRSVEAENRLLTSEYLAKIAEINLVVLSGNLRL